MQRKIATWLIAAGVALVALACVQLVFNAPAFAAPGTLQPRPTLPPARPTVGQRSQPEPQPAATEAPTAAPEPAAAPTAEAAPAPPATMPATGAGDHPDLTLLALIGSALLIAGSVIRASDARQAASGTRS